MTHAVSPSELSKLPTNKTKRLYRLPARFYGYQLFVLIVLALLFTWLSRDESLDRWITGVWYDAATHHFPLQQNPLLDLLNHSQHAWLDHVVADVGREFVKHQTQRKK